MKTNRRSYRKVVQNNIKSRKIKSFRQIALEYKTKKSDMAREKEIQIINKWIPKKTEKFVPINQKRILKNKKLEKLKRDPKRFFKDSKFIILRPLQYLFKGQK